MAIKVMADNNQDIEAKQELLYITTYQDIRSMIFLKAMETN